MCGEHRSRVIREIKERLQRGEPIRGVCTQLVEAGVDIDFPVVYRAMAGLDSIAQAAGRCNREGRLDRGQLLVLITPHPSPPGLLRKAEAAGRQALTQHAPDPLAPLAFHDYFTRLLAGGKFRCTWNLRGPQRNAGTLKVEFRTAAAKFRLIGDEQAPVIVRYGESETWTSLLRAQWARALVDAQTSTLRRQHPTPHS